MCVMILLEGLLELVIYLKVENNVSGYQLAKLWHVHRLECSTDIKNYILLARSGGTCL